MESNISQDILLQISFDNIYKFNDINCIDIYSKMFRFKELF